MGKSSLGLSYGLTLTDLMLAPFIPSNTVRGGGIIFPIINSLTGGCDSTPHHPSRKKIGAYSLTLHKRQIFFSKQTLNRINGYSTHILSP